MPKKKRSPLPFKIQGCLAEIHKDISKSFVRPAKGHEGYNPENVTAGSHHVFIWRCDNPEHGYRSSAVYNIAKLWAKGNNGCRQCYETKMLRGNGDIAHQYKQSITQFVRPANKKNAHYNPKNVTTNSQKIFVWRCDNPEHPNWQTTVQSMVRSWDNDKNGCQQCSIETRETALLAKYGSLRTHHPSIADQFVRPAKGHEGYTPDIVTSRSNRVFVWECPECHHHWSARITSRTLQGSGCPTCHWMGWELKQLRENWQSLKAGDTKCRKQLIKQLGLRKTTGAGRTIIEAWLAKQISDQNLEAFLAGKINDEVEKCLQAHDSSIYGGRPTIPRKIRCSVLQRDKYQCKVCGCSKKSKLRIDHIIPWSKGGDHAFTNLQTLCIRCNNIKRDKEITNAELAELIKGKKQSVKTPLVR